MNERDSGGGLNCSERAGDVGVVDSRRAEVDPTPVTQIDNIVDSESTSTEEDLSFYVAVKTNIVEDSEEGEQSLIVQQKEEEEGERIRDEFGLSVDKSVADEYAKFKSETLERLSFEIETRWKEKGVTSYNVEQLLEEQETKNDEEEEHVPNHQRGNHSADDEKKEISKRNSERKKEDIHKLIYEHGIPNSMRGKIWYWLTRADETEQRSKIGYWSSLVKTKTNVTKAIEKDVTRTFPGHPFFDSPSGQHSLLRLLTAYSVFNPTLGYCQSMNFLCGTILLVESYDEERTFWMFVSLIESLLQDYFGKSMIGLQIDQKVIDDLLAERMPKVKSHLDKIGFSLPMVADWLMCVYVNVFPMRVQLFFNTSIFTTKLINDDFKLKKKKNKQTKTTLRIWDRVLSQEHKQVGGGKDEIIRVGLSIFRYFERDILMFSDPVDAIQFIRHISRLFFDTTPLFKAMESIGSLDSKHMKHLRRNHWSKAILDYENSMTSKLLSRPSKFNSVELKFLHDIKLRCSQKAESQPDVNKYLMIQEDIDFCAYRKFILHTFPRSSRVPQILPKLFEYQTVGDGLVKFMDVVVLLGILDRGSTDEKLNEWIQIFDGNKDGKLEWFELGELLVVLYMIYFEEDYSKEIMAEYKPKLLESLSFEDSMTELLTHSQLIRAIKNTTILKVTAASGS